MPSGWGLEAGSGTGREQGLSCALGKKVLVQLGSFCRRVLPAQMLAERYVCFLAWLERALAVDRGLVQPG